MEKIFSKALEATREADVGLADLWRRFKRCYEQRATDHLAESVVGRLQRMDFTVSLLAAERKGLLLDIGGADGLLAQELGGMSCDVSLTYCRRIKQNGVAVVNCVGESLPFADKAFDTVTCTEVLEHMLYPERAIEEIHRIAKNDGSILISVPYRQKHLCRHAKYEFTHLRKYDEKLVEDLSNLFTVESVSYYGFRFKTIRVYNPSVNRILDRMWRLFGRFLNRIGGYGRPTYIFVLLKNHKLI